MHIFPLTQGLPGGMDLKQFDWRITMTMNLYTITKVLHMLESPKPNLGDVLLKECVCLKNRDMGHICQSIVHAIVQYLYTDLKES